ncbi:MAG: hypothetical protein KC516_01765 [Nanoarchaeota archaeon]|nr:hypothetical protein [Nanoarchaeota archaeon]
MNLSRKKALAARTLRVGKEKISFVQARLNDIKEAITKQDIQQLKAEGAIVVKNPSGRRKNAKKHNKRSTGNIKKKVKTRKKDYVIMTRKLRAFSLELFKQNRINKEELKEIRKKIRNRYFKSKSHLKSYVEVLKK